MILETGEVKLDKSGCVSDPSRVGEIEGFGILRSSNSAGWISTDGLGGFPLIADDPNAFHISLSK